MGIAYLEKQRLFKLDTPQTTYVLGMVGSEQYLGHIYYGKKLECIEGIEAALRLEETPFMPDCNDRNRTYFFDCFPFEYPGHGVGDGRESAVRIRDVHGNSAVCFTYVSHEILKGKEKLCGLPAVWGTEEEITTLKIYCEDKVTGLEAVLSYSVFENLDIITRNVCIMNKSMTPVWLEKVMSCSIDMDSHDYEVLTLHGEATRERHKFVQKIDHGSFSIGSLRGRSSHQEHPFMAVMTPNTTETQGEVYGFHFVYSGNFKMQVSNSQYDSLRILVGIHPEDFSWKLDSGEYFQAPEVVMTYSANGIGKMTRNLHDLYRNHLIRSLYLHKKRPILINNWEATYFDFDEEKLLSIAKESAKLGIEMLVMDDGWFGDRFDDNRSLGDWRVNQKKLPKGLDHLVKQVNAQKMKFGIWFEPEMISPDSELYRQHPDWALSIKGRTPGRYRNQLVLDITRREVREHILQQMLEILHSANIEYVKWDMNRSLSDVGNLTLPPEQQGEIFHRYVLGLYEMQERLLQEFPNLLLENCCAGGGRFDPGMLYYSPQIWCSDNTDAIERLAIQESTAMLYPLSTMGAHVSVCPNHVMGRTTPFETRAIVALTGTFGYELDITKLSDKEKLLIPRQIQLYHFCNEIIREGTYYRLASYQENHLYDCFQVNGKMEEQILVFYVQVLAEARKRSRMIPLQQLDENAVYQIYEVDWDITDDVSRYTMEESKLKYEMEGTWRNTGKSASGEVLMNVGLQMERMKGDFQGKLFLLERK